MSCMAGFLLVLGLLTHPSALPEFTVSPANLVTAWPTDRPAIPTDGRIKITCRSTGTVVSNCDILEILRGDNVYLGGKHLLTANHLKEIEAEVLKGLGQLQEV